MEGEIHYLPNNYIGKVRILFKHKDGTDKEYKNSKRVYRIPPSGQLRTKFTLNHGWTSTDDSHEFYFVGKDSLIPIKKLISTKDFDNIDSNSIYIMGYGIGEMSSDTLSSEYCTYIVDTLKNLKKYGY